MSLIHERATAAQHTIDLIAALDLTLQSNAADQQRACDLLLELTARHELFNAQDYPIKPGTDGGFYRLAEHADRRHALYVSVGVAGLRNNPHRHPAWAIIAGIVGDERNRVYRRTDDGSVPLHGTLEQIDDLVVGPGKALFMREGEYHNIEVADQQSTLHLHLYGIGVDGPENAVAPVFDGPGASTYSLHARSADDLRIAVPVLSSAQLAETQVQQRELAWINLGGQTEAPSDALSLAELGFEGLLQRLPADPATPLVLVGDTAAVEALSERLARHGHFCTLHWRGES